jgi:hypothetical protein
MNIRRIKREDIEEKKWNGCVHYASNGNPYGYTWHLDAISEAWEGLVEGDYESVFPLVWNDKLLGKKQLYQPFFAQQLGVYSIKVLSQKRIETFLRAIPDEYRYINLNLNEGNTLIGNNLDFLVTEKPNYTLRLRDDYDTIYDRYSDNLKRNLKRTAAHKLTLTSNIKPEKLVEMYRTHQGPKMPELNDAAYHAAHRVIYNALHRGMGFLSGITNDKNELIAADFFLTSKHKIVNLMPATTPEGREKRAMHLLLDLQIRQNAMKPLIFDFEGSSVPGVAKFYQSFGATLSTYPCIERDALPFWIKWLRALKQR